MKKVTSFVILLVMVLSISFMFAGCANYTYETETVEVSVVTCEKGRYERNASYAALASQALIRKDTAKYAMYNSLANTTGTQKYNITIIIDGVEYVVERNDEIEPNTTIEVEKTIAYDEDGTIVKISYR